MSNKPQWHLKKKKRNPTTNLGLWTCIGKRRRLRKEDKFYHKIKQKYYQWQRMERESEKNGEDEKSKKEREREESEKSWKGEDEEKKIWGKIK